MVQLRKPKQIILPHGFTIDRVEILEWFVERNSGLPMGAFEYVTEEKDQYERHCLVLDLTRSRECLRKIDEVFRKENFAIWIG